MATDTDAEKWRLLQAEWVLEAAKENNPAAFVARSRPAHTPTHDLFSWEDGGAAHAERIEEAKQIIRKV